MHAAWRSALLACVTWCLFSTASVVAAPIWVTGFESGILSDYPANNGQAKWFADGTTEVVQSGTRHGGSYALQLTWGAGKASAFRFDTQDAGQMSLRYYVYIAALPTANMDIISGGLPNTNTSARIGRLYVTPTGQSQLAYKNAAGTVTGAVNGPVLTTGTWYRIDLAVNTQGTTWTSLWSVNGLPQTPTNLAGMTADTIFQFQVGSATVGDTAQVYVDDFAVTDTTADYPIGAGSSLGFRIDGAGTHATPGSFQDDDSTAIDPTSWTRLDDPVASTGVDHVKQTVTGANSFLEWTLQNTALPQTANWVSAVMASHSSSATSVTGTTKVVRNGDSDAAAPVLYGGNMATNASLGYHQNVIAAPVAGWTPSEVNALKIRMGYVNPVGTQPYWDAAMVEVDSPDGPVDPPSGLYTNDTNATAGSTNPTTIASATPRFSVNNTTGGAATLERTQVLNTPLNNVVALWKMDAAPGPTVDSTGNAHTLALAGGPTNPTGKYAESLKMTGTQTATATTSPAFNLVKDFGVDGWFKTSSIANDPYPSIITRSDVAATRFNFEVVFDRASNTIDGNVSVNGGTQKNVATPAGPWVDGTWHHFALVIDAGNVMRLYLDGAQYDNTPLNAGVVDNPNVDVMVSGDLSGGSRFNGEVDDIRISRGSMTPADILGYMNSNASHGTVLWDSSTSDAGNAIANCAKGARCTDIVYGSSGAPVSLVHGGVRYYVTSKLRGAFGSWSAWSTPDWFETTTTAAPTAQFTHDTNAQANYTNPIDVAAATPHFSWMNTGLTTAAQQRVQVFNDVTDSSVVGLWHFDTATGVTTDASGNGRTLIPTAAPTSPAGQAGFAEALELNGTTQHTRAAPDAALQLTEDFTVQARFRTNGIPTAFPTLVENSSGGCAGTCNYALQFIQSGAKFQATATVGGVSYKVQTSSTPYTDNLWHSATMTVSSTNLMTFYVDGVSVGSTQMPGAADTSSNGVFIGASQTLAANGRFTGSLDEVRILNRALTSAEVAGYDATLAPHGTVMWDSSPSDAGVALAACAPAARCADVVYGTGGGSTALRTPGARYYVRMKARQVGDAWSAWSTPDWFEMSTPTLSVSAGPSLGLGSVVAGADASASTPITVTTNATHGYTLLATDGSDANGGGLLPGFATTIPDWTGTNATPTAWAAGANGTTGYVGVCVTGVTGPAARLAKWGSGTTAFDYVNNRYAGLKLGSSTTLHTRPTLSVAPEDVTLSVRLGVGTAVPSGTFQDTITVVALANP